VRVIRGKEPSHRGGHRESLFQDEAKAKGVTGFSIRKGGGERSRRRVRPLCAALDTMEQVTSMEVFHKTRQKSTLPGESRKKKASTRQRKKPWEEFERGARHLKCPKTPTVEDL